MQEHNRHFDFLEAEGFKGGQMYGSRECILQFTAEVIPIQRVRVVRRIDGETLQTTEWELENGNERRAIQLQGHRIFVMIDSDISDKGLNDRVFDKELMKPLAGSITFERNCREELFATG